MTLWPWTFWKPSNLLASRVPRLDHYLACQAILAQVLPSRCVCSRALRPVVLYATAETTPCCHKVRLFWHPLFFPRLTRLGCLQTPRQGSQQEAPTLQMPMPLVLRTTAHRAIHRSSCNTIDYFRMYQQISMKSSPRCWIALPDTSKWCNQSYHAIIAQLKAATISLIFQIQVRIGLNTVRVPGEMNGEKDQTRMIPQKRPTKTCPCSLEAESKDWAWWMKTPKWNFK